MELYFLRHGIAVEPTDWNGSDSERPLTAEGIRKMKKAVEGMRESDLRFDRIISSPFERARHTAELVAKGLEHKEKVVFSELLVPQAEFKDFLKLLKTLPSGKKTLLVGHQPSIGDFISGLIAGGEAILDVKKGGMALVQVALESSAGELQWLTTSKQLRDMA